MKRNRIAEVKCRKQMYSVFVDLLYTYGMAAVIHKFGALCTVLVGGKYNVEGSYSDSVRCGGLCDVKWATLAW
jgi:hypothetical protein